CCSAPVSSRASSRAACTASSRTRSRRPRRATASPTCSASMYRRRSWKGCSTQSDPPSEIRPVCVLFLDIRGFTAMTRARAPDQTVALLNDFFAAMVAIVDRHHGIINKFLGDGFLALFGAPLEDLHAAANALAAAQAMIEA